MAGLLLTAGPVATRKSVNGLSRMFRFLVTSAKFEAAASKLQEAHLGHMVSLKGSAVAWKGNVFIKKPPAEARQILESNAALCVTLEEYTQRYHMPTPASVTPKIKAGLVQLGLVPSTLFEMDGQDVGDAGIARAFPGAGE